MPHPRVAPAAWPRLTRRGGTLVAAGALLLPTAMWFDLRDVLLLAFVALAMPLAAMGFVWLRSPRLAVTRSFGPAVVAAGSATRATITVQNLSRRTFDGARWTDRVPPGLSAPVESILPALGPWERSSAPLGDDTARIEYQLRMPRRGVYQVGPLLVSISDPFGLARMQRPAGRAEEVVATPRVTSLEAVHGTVASVDGSLRGLQLRTHPNADEPLAREYRYGDPLRRVHWAATARRGELMVREEEQRGDPEARVLVDVRLAARPKYAQFRDPFDSHNPGFELGMELAASVGAHLLERGCRVRCDRLHDPDRGVSDVMGTSYRMPLGDRELLEDLARVDAPGTRTSTTEDPAVLAVAAPRAREARMPGFAVLIEPDGDDARTLISLRHRFEPAVVFAADTVSSVIVDLLEHADWRVVQVQRVAEIGWAWSEAARPGVGVKVQASAT